jgi:prepilin-type N-terminal cleavage/methylation domain-containing protein
LLPIEGRSEEKTADMTARGNAGGEAGRRGRRDERGLTMIELVVAISVFAILAGGLALTIDGGLNLARNNRNRSIAANLASQEMDKVRQSPFISLPLGLLDRTESVDGVPYTVRRESEWTNNASTTAPCQADAAHSEPRVMRVTVSVFWRDMRGVAPAKSSTILSPPVGSYDPNNGHIAVRVRDSSANPLLGVPVTVTGPGVNKTLTSTSDGCAFFAFIPASTYTVSLGAAQYVDRQGVANPAQVTGVTSGETSSIAFDYDHAATLNLTLSSPGGGSFPSSIGVGVGNTNLTPTGSKLFSGVGAARTIGNLFPYPDGYGVWAGTCADADPIGADGNGLAFWPGATRETELDTDPGGIATGTVNLPTVELNYGAVSISAGTHSVVATHAADNGCPTGLTYTVGTFSGPANTLIALPYGTWTFTVTGASPYGGAWPTVTLDPRVTGNFVANVDSL